MESWPDAGTPNPNKDRVSKTYPRILGKHSTRHLPMSSTIIQKNRPPENFKFKYQPSFKSYRCGSYGINLEKFWEEVTSYFFLYTNVRSSKLVILLIICSLKSTFNFWDCWLLQTLRSRSYLIGYIVLSFIFILILYCIYNNFECSILCFVFHYNYNKFKCLHT
jgi:hypothetical protein